MPFVFPSLPGLGWSVHKKPSFSTRVAQHVSGREVRAPLYSQGLYEFELTIDGLDSTGFGFPNLGNQSLQALMGLYIQCQGQYGTFLFVDSTDTVAIDQYSGSQNAGGTLTAFTMERSINYSTEPISWVTGVSLAYINGTANPQYKLKEDNTTNVHSCGQTISAIVALGQPFTVSCYVQAVERTQCQLILNDGSTNRSCNFDLSAVTATPGSGITASSITVAPNGWYLITASVSMAATSSPSSSLVLMKSGSSSYAGTTGQGLFFSSFMYSYGNTAAAFFTSLALTHATFTGPNWTITQPNTIIFASAPAANAFITADSTFAFNCRFTDDQDDFEEFMSGLWRVETLKFRSVKP